VYQKKNIDYTGEIGWATGFGRLMTEGRRARYLMQVDIQMSHSKECEKHYVRNIPFNSTIEICSLYKKGYLKGVCNVNFKIIFFSFKIFKIKRDSGGPLVIKNKADSKWYLAGATSWGTMNNCGEGSVFSRTSFYYDWILDKISNN
jgi:hypothetical protein